MSRLADAWERVEETLKRVPHAPPYVQVFPALPPIVGYRAWVHVRYVPPGGKKRRRDRYEGEGMTLAEAFDDLADQLAAAAQEPER
jgi:hypothetical protein